MSRLVRVRVPGSRVEGSVHGTAAATAQWLTASFALDASRAGVLERGGTLAALTTPTNADLVLGGFHAACDVADRDPPATLRVRVVSTIPLGAGLGAAAAAAVAGVVGARALLGLGFDDDAAIRIATGIGGAAERVAASVAAHHCSIAPACNDDSAPNETAPIVSDACGSSRGATPDGDL